MARKYGVKMRRGFNVGRVAAKIGGTVLALWVGGFVISEIGNAALGHCSPFFEGLSLIGWDTGNNATAIAGRTEWTATSTLGCNDQANSENILYDVSEAGILSVVGIIGVASIIMEFVEFRIR